MVCKKNNAYNHEPKISNLSGISLLNVGEGFVAIKNDDGHTIPNASGVIIQGDGFPTYIENENENENENELNMLRLFYLGGISITGLYLFYRIMSKQQ
jgi:hypothetical protein